VLVLPATVHTPALARTHVHRFADNWLQDLLDVVLLVVTEAVTNAVRHGSGRVELAMWVTSGRIRIEVSEANPSSPVRRAGADTNGDGLTESGRGLYLIDALTDAWGTEPHPEGGGKTVWPELHSRSASGLVARARRSERTMGLWTN